MMPSSARRDQNASVPELVCYVQPNWAPRIRPASSQRDWMEASPDRYAYRCLPLAVANSHGWEIGSPCGFEACWDGGVGVESLQIRCAPDVPARRVPISLFGMGVITFHVEGLLRTSPGWNTFVSGPPNAAKDGIAPLSGIIETDWAPYTFTMNWRLTRPHHWVRFVEDEPFCFFFPVQRGLIGGVTPAILPLSDNQPLGEGFAKWSADRNAFHERVREQRPSAPTDQWQKLYFRGLQPDGTSGPNNHESKIRARPFTGVKRSCPVPLTTDPPNEENSRAALQLEQSIWVLDIMEQQRALSPLAGGIPRLDDISPEDFLHYFYAPGRPVILQSAIGDWPAVARWSQDYLRNVLGETVVEYQGSRTGHADYELEKDRHRQSAPFNEFMDIIDREAGNGSYITAYNSKANALAFEPLLADLGSLPLLSSNNGMLWIGPEGTFTPLHFDLTNNLIAQIRGSKHVILLPPSETHKLANDDFVFSKVGDLTCPDSIEKYPAAQDARRFELTLEAGQILYVPIGWWHQLRAESFSVSATYTNFIWPNDAYRSFPSMSQD